MKNTLFTLASIVSLTIITASLWPTTPQAHAEQKTEGPATPEVQVTYEKHSIDDILKDSSDEELVKISGEIIKQIKGRTYLFRGKTGDIHIRIDDDSVPDKGIQFKQPTVINGSVSQENDQSPKVEADHIRFVF